MLKGPKRSYVVLLLFGGVESWAKNVPNEKKKISRTKNVTKGTKNVHEQKMCADKKCSKWNKIKLNFFFEEVP